MQITTEDTSDKTELIHTQMACCLIFMIHKNGQRMVKRKKE